jgi:hypothetical protein
MKTLGWTHSVCIVLRLVLSSFFSYLPHPFRNRVIYTYRFGFWSQSLPVRSDVFENSGLHEAGATEGCTAQAQRNRGVDPRRRFL